MDLLRVDLFALVFGAKGQRAKKFSPGTVLLVIVQLCSALAYLRRHRYIYADVKQENVMVRTHTVETIGDEDHVTMPFISLVDFNAMQRVDSPDIICQTARLRAPEVIMGLNYDERIDSFSVGVVALEFFISRYLFHVTDVREDAEEKYAHLALIETVVDKHIPRCMYDHSGMTHRGLPKVDEYIPTMPGILAALEPSTDSAELQALVPLLMAPNPAERISPAKVYEGLKSRIPW